MIWVIRAGMGGSDYNYFVSTKRAYLSWEGYRKDLRNYPNLSDMKMLVKEEKGTTSEVSIRTWSSQLMIFAYEISKGDLVFIPSEKSKDYCLARIIGPYDFSEDLQKYYHFHEIEIIKEHIPKSYFSKRIVNSMGAFRTIFKPACQEEIINSLKENGVLL